MNENIKKLIRENFMKEDYPTNFDLNEFSALPSYVKRIQYCEERLSRISSGSARVVYKIDDEKVLKIAKNRKGLAQNEVEIEYGAYSYLKDILANVINYDTKKNLWVEMELAKKVTNKIFKNMSGIDFNTLGIFLRNYRNLSGHLPEDVVEKIYDDEFLSALGEYKDGYNIPVGDLVRASSYGIVNRGNGDELVLVDFGLNDDVYNGYYR